MIRTMIIAHSSSLMAKPSRCFQPGHRSATIPVQVAAFRYFSLACWGARKRIRFYIWIMTIITKILLILSADRRRSRVVWNISMERWQEAIKLFVSRAFSRQFIWKRAEYASTVSRSAGSASIENNAANAGTRGLSLSVTAIHASMDILWMSIRTCAKVTTAISNIYWFCY